MGDTHAPLRRTPGAAPVRRRGTALLAVGLLVLTAACGPGSEGGGPPRDGDRLPELSARTLAGDSVTTAAYAGRGLLLNLWATWCPPCRAEMPYLQELADRYGEQGLTVVGLSVDDAGARSAILRFLEEAQIEYPVLHDPSMASMDRLGVPGLPATFLVDPEGRVREFRMGPLEEGDTLFLAAVESVLPGAGGDEATRETTGETR